MQEIDEIKFGEDKKSIFHVFPELETYKRLRHTTTYKMEDRKFLGRADRYFNGIDGEINFHEYLEQKIRFIDVNLDDGYFIRRCLEDQKFTTFMKYLLANGADIKKAGITSLHLACYFGDVGKVKELMKNSNDIEAKTIDGLAPYDVTNNILIRKLLGKEETFFAGRVDDMNTNKYPKFFDNFDKNQKVFQEIPYQKDFRKKTFESSESLNENTRNNQEFFDNHRNDKKDFQEILRQQNTQKEPSKTANNNESSGCTIL